MQFVDLAAQQERLKPRIDAAIQQVMAHGRYVLGPEVVQLEERLARYTGASHCIGVANGTDALLIALMALGVGRGDEVIIPGFSFIGTAEAVVLSGARPVYVDIEPGSLNLDPAALEPAITNRTRAIMPVSLYGQCADFDAINAIAAKHGLPVIEDAAQSFGASYHGTRSGNLSTLACASFFPSKPLGAYGDGGAILTSDNDLARIARQIASHGEESGASRHRHGRLGMNSRLDTLQAAILLCKLEIFDEELMLREAAASVYRSALAGANLISVPEIQAGNSSAWAQYTVRVPEREAVQSRLQSAGVPCAVHYPVPLYRQPAVTDESAALPKCEQAAAAVLSLPMHPYLKEQEIELIGETLIEACYSRSLLTRRAAPQPATAPPDLK